MQARNELYKGAGTVLDSVSLSEYEHASIF